MLFLNMNHGHILSKNFSSLRLSLFQNLKNSRIAPNGKITLHQQNVYLTLKNQITKLGNNIKSLVVFGIEICYAAETAFVSPILQKIGVPVQFMSMVWGLSPIVGFFTCPILGSLSDACTSKLGRRRPFIIIYSIGILLGLVLTGYGHIISNLLWNESNTGPNPYLILITIVGVILLDFDCDACQSPARAYLIDVSPSDDHSAGLSTFTLMAGAGGSLGYLLGGIPWGEIFHSKSKESLDKIFVNSSLELNETNDFYEKNLAYDHKQILFSFVAVIYVICAFISLTSFKEIPLATSKNTKNDKNKSDKESSMLKYNRMSEDLSSVEEDSSETNATKIHESICNNQLEDLSQIEILKYYLTSIIRMPTSLRWLCVTHCFSWMSLLCYSLYFTDFVGEEVFGGIPIGDETLDNHLHKLYDQGVRTGSYFMALYSISCSVYSFFLQYLMNNFSTKNVYRFSQIIYSIGMLVLAITKNKIVAALSSLSAGIIYSSLFTIPFVLVANYHSTETFELLEKQVKSNDPTSPLSNASKNSEEINKIKRGLGTDLSLMSSMVFVAQFILSFFIGTLMKYFAKSAVFYTASTLSFISFITSSKVLYLD